MYTVYGWRSGVNRNSDGEVSSADSGRRNVSAKRINGKLLIILGYFDIVVASSEDSLP